MKKKRLTDRELRDILAEIPAGSPYAQACRDALAYRIAMKAARRLLRDQFVALASATLRRAMEVRP